MKTLLTMLLSLTIISGVSAQRKAFYPVIRPVHSPRIYITPFSYGLGYNPYYGYSRFGYSPLGYPYGYNNRYRQMPYKLELQIESIKQDYQLQIREARKDKSLKRKQRKQEISNLKIERDKEIIHAKKDYSKSRPAATGRSDNP